MATIEFKENRYRVQIRKKGTYLTKTFKNKEDAELWAKYKEDIIDLVDAFQPPPNELITLREAMDIKCKEAKEKGITDRQIVDIRNCCINDFGDMLDKPISNITMEYAQKKADEFTHKTVFKGGHRKTGTGNLRIMSKRTLHVKFILLNGVLNCLIKKGINFENHIQNFLHKHRHLFKD